nr:hypothetical protein [Tanacetum cinerariifolium]
MSEMNSSSSTPEGLYGHKFLMESTKSPMFEEQAEAIIHYCKDKFDIIAAINVVGIGGYLMVHDAVVLARCICPVYHTPCDMEVLGRGTKVLYDDGDEDVLNLNQRQRT